MVLGVVVWPSCNKCTAALLLHKALIKFVIFISLDSHFCKHSIDWNLWACMLLSLITFLLLHLVVLLLNTDLLLADRTCVFSLKPLSNTGWVKPMKTHQHHVFLPNFVIRLTDSAEFVFLWKVLLVGLSKLINWQGGQKIGTNWVRIVIIAIWVQLNTSKLLVVFFISVWISFMLVHQLRIMRQTKSTS